MKRTFLTIVVVCLLLAVISGQAMAAYEFYLQIRGVPGESVEAKHPGWILLQGFGSKSLTIPTAPSGSSGPGVFSVKHYGSTKVSPLLLNLLLTNASFDLKLDMVEGARVLHQTFTGCRLTSYYIVRSAEPRPMEELTFSYMSQAWSWGT